MDKNKFIYWFVNNDGMRLMRINHDEIFPLSVSIFIALNHYGKTLNELTVFDYRQFAAIICKINNKMTLGNLCDILKLQTDKWSAKNYNLATNNCQTFAAEIIKILGAKRKYKRDKIRMIEKRNLPNCIINALSKNEKIYKRNIIGKIPIIGLIHDVYYEQIKLYEFKNNIRHKIIESDNEFESDDSNDDF